MPVFLKMSHKNKKNFFKLHKIGGNWVFRFITATVIWIIFQKILVI